MYKGLPDRIPPVDEWLGPSARSGWADGSRRWLPSTARACPRSASHRKRSVGQLRKKRAQACQACTPELTKLIQDGVFCFAVYVQKSSNFVKALWRDTTHECKISRTMTLNLQTLLESLGGQALFLAAVAFLCKAFVSSRLTRDADAFRARLKADADTEIERLRSSLQIAATEHQVRFSKLHEKRGEVIEQLYKLIVETPTVAGRFILTDNRNPEAARVANERVGELFSFLSLNRIYLPSSVCRRLDNYEHRLRHSVTWVTIYWTRVEYPNQKMIEDQNKALQEACTELETELPAIRRELEDEFRKLLGVEMGNG
jgi:hypothetical protein